VLVVAKAEDVDRLSGSKDWLVVSTVGRVSKPILLWDYLPAIAFVIILVMAAMEYQPFEFLAGIMMGVTVLLVRALDTHVCWRGVSCRLSSF
jgi:hypothetical protein